VATAAPNEIKVFTDELASYGQHTLETHANKASRAGRAVAGRRTPLQVMPEYSYGIWHNWEFSLQLPAAFGRDGSALEGYRAELQYVAPHDHYEGFYWGLNFEFARLDRWHLVANPGLDKAVSGASGSVNFQPAAKIACRALEQNYFGIEYYVEAGPLRNRISRNEQSRVLYLAWDGKLGKSDINLALGRGTTDSSDRWVLKMIYEFAF
jgi:hypothetical protein